MRRVASKVSTTNISHGNNGNMLNSSDIGRRHDEQPAVAGRGWSRPALEMPGYLRVAADIAAQIEDGRLAPGAALPTGRELCARHQVSRQTIERAILILKERRLVWGRQGRAVYVSEPPHIPGDGG